MRQTRSSSDKLRSVQEVYEYDKLIKQRDFEWKSYMKEIRNNAFYNSYLLNIKEKSAKARSRHEQAAERRQKLLEEKKKKIYLRRSKSEMQRRNCRSVMVLKPSSKPGVFINSIIYPNQLEGKDGFGKGFESYNSDVSIGSKKGESIVNTAVYETKIPFSTKAINHMRLRKHNFFNYSQTSGYGDRAFTYQLTERNERPATATYSYTGDISISEQHNFPLGYSEIHNSPISQIPIQSTTNNNPINSITSTEHVIDDDDDDNDDDSILQNDDVDDNDNNELIENVVNTDDEEEGNNETEDDNNNDDYEEAVSMEEEGYPLQNHEAGWNIYNESDDMCNCGGSHSLLTCGGDCELLETIEMKKELILPSVQPESISPISKNQESNDVNEQYNNDQNYTTVHKLRRYNYRNINVTKQFASIKNKHVTFRPEKVMQIKENGRPIIKKALNTQCPETKRGILMKMTELCSGRRKPSPYVKTNINSKNEELIECGKNAEVIYKSEKKFVSVEPVCKFMISPSIFTNTGISEPIVQVANVASTSQYGDKDISNLGRLLDNCEKEKENRKLKLAKLHEDLKDIEEKTKILAEKNTEYNKRLSQNYPKNKINNEDLNVYVEDSLLETESKAKLFASFLKNRLSLKSSSFNTTSSMSRSSIGPTLSKKSSNNDTTTNYTSAPTNLTHQITVNIPPTSQDQVDVDEDNLSNSCGIYTTPPTTILASSPPPLITPLSTTQYNMPPLVNKASRIIRSRPPIIMSNPNNFVTIHNNSNNSSCFVECNKVNELQCCTYPISIVNINEPEYYSTQFVVDTHHPSIITNIGY